MIEAMGAQSSAYDRKIEEFARRRYPETALLRQVSGVGALTALTYVLTLEDPGRFRDPRAVGSYLGLRPRRADSGDLSPQLHIAKAGDEMLRRLLVGSAQYVLGPFGPDTDLRRWGLALAARGGKRGKRLAVVAVARKLKRALAAPLGDGRGLRTAAQCGPCRSVALRAGLTGRRRRAR
jgi:transposase